MADNDKQIRQQHAALDLQMKRLEVQDLTDRLAERKARRDEIVRIAKAQQMAMDMAAKREAADQAQCNHQKGGMGMEGILGGTDSKRCVIKHTLPLGDLIIMCTRCGKKVMRPNAKLAQSEPEKYAAQLAEYKEWANFSTDNLPSGNTVFILQGSQEAINAARARVTY